MINGNLFIQKLWRRIEKRRGRNEFGEFAFTRTRRQRVTLLLLKGHGNGRGGMNETRQWEGRKWNVTFEQGYVGTRGLHAARTKGRQKWKTLPSERWRRFVSAVRPISLPFYRSPVNTAPLSISNVTASSLLLRLLHNARIYHESLDGTSPSFVYGCSFSVNIRQERGPFCHSFLLCQTRFLNR